MTSPITVTLEQVTALRNGLDPILATIQEALQAKAYAAQLPIIGNKLAAAFDAGQAALTQFQTFETDLTTVLNALNDAQGYSLSDLQTQIDNAVALSGFTGIPQLALDLQGNLTVSLAETDSQTFSQTLADNFGLPNLGFQTSGTAQASIDYGLNLSASVDTSGNFSIAQSTTPALQVGLDVSAPNFSADAQLGALQFAAADQGSGLNGSFAIDDQGNATFTGGATLAVGLTSDLGDAALPSVSATLAGDWNFAGSSVDPSNIASFGSAPSVEFDGVTFDFGAFFDKFVKPILDKVVPYMQPVQQALAVLNTDITFIKDLLPNNAWQALDKAGAVDASGNDAPDGKITLLDLLKLAKPTQNFAPVVQTLQTIQQVISLAAFLDNTSLGPDSYDLGNIKILDDIRAASFNVTKAATQLVQQGQSLANFLQDSGGAYASEVQGTGATFGNLLAGLIPNDGSGSGATATGLSLPILTDPSSLGQFLLGGTTALVNLNMPSLSVGVGSLGSNGAATNVAPIITVPLPIPLPGINLALAAALSVSAGINFGYDTSGLLAYAQGGFTDPSLIADGAWISNPSSGDLLSVGGAVQANVEAGVPGAATIGGGGVLSGVLNLSLTNPGKNYLDQLATAVSSDPLSIFSASGAITAAADLDVSVAGVDWYRYLSPLVTLASFSATGSTAPNGGTTGAAMNTSIPNVQSVYLTAIDGDPNLLSGDYGAGHVMQITVTFSQAVTVTGTPVVTLNSNGQATYDPTATAALKDPTKLVFDYTVAAGDASIPGLAFTGISLPSGATISNSSNLAADLTDLPEIYFNGVSLETTSPKAYAAQLYSVNGQASETVANLNVGHPVKLELTFTHEVSVSGSPQLTLNDGGVATYDAAATAALKDPTRLIFDYTVGPHDKPVANLAVTGITLPSGASIMDQASNAADLSAVANTFTGLQVLEPTPSGNYPLDLQFWSDTLGVTQDGTDNVVVVGDGFQGAGSLPSLIVQPLGSGTVPTPLVLDSTTDSMSFSTPTAATLSNGDIVTAWVHINSGQTIRAAIVDPQGTIVVPAFQVNASTTDVLDQLSVAALSGGGFAVAWMDHSTSGETVNTQVFDNSGKAVGSPSIATTDGYGYTTTPSVIALSNGDYLVSWQMKNGWTPGGQLYAADGTAIGAPLMFGGANLVTAPLAGGGFAAAWSAQNTVMVQTFDASGKAIGNAQPAAGDYSASSNPPRIAGLTNGGFVVGWDVGYSGYGSQGSVQQGQYFDAAANRVGSPFLIGSVESGPGYPEGLTPLPNGNFVAYWDAFGPAPAIETFTPGTTVAPDVTLPTRLSMVQNAVPAGGVNLGVTINDVNAIEQDSLTLSVGHGTLDFGGVDGGSFWATNMITGGASQSGSISLASRAELLNQLMGMGATYTPDAGFTGADTLTVAATVGGWQQTYAVPIIVDALPTGTVAVTGVAVPGHTLTADTSTLADANGLGTLHYQWQTSTDTFNWTDVGSDQPSYSVQGADNNSFVRLVVSYIDAIGASETMTSNNAPLVSASGPSIDSADSVTTGTVTEGSPPDVSTLRTVSGVIDFTDDALTSTHTATIFDYGSPFGTMTAAVTKDSTGTGSGQVTWTYQGTDAQIAALLGSAPSADIQFDVEVSDQYGNFTDAYGDVTVNAATTLPCFLAGTLILTQRGEVRVEALRERDMVMTAVAGSAAPVVWIGHRDVDCRRHPNPESVWPVRISANAFGKGMPRRMLMLSPDHAVYVNKVLVPVKYLINGTTIRQVKRDRVRYHHVELARHDVLYANGMLAESYLDVGDRSNFANGGRVVQLQIDLAHRWEAGGCAPLVIYGPQLDAVKQVVAAHAYSDDTGNTGEPMAERGA